MATDVRPPGQWLLCLGAWLASFSLIGLLAACTAAPAQPKPPTAADSRPVSTSVPAAATPAATPVPVRPLKVEPVKGNVGDRFTITAEEVPSGKSVEFVWVTWDGSYTTKAVPETVEFYERSFAEKRVTLGRATSDASGRVAASFTVPEDYGELHDIHAVVDGQSVARGGYRILPEFTMSPLEGPVGTPITLKARGIGWKNWESTWAVNYDNKYVGFVSAVTTRGSATAVIRATGPVGKHTVDVWHAGQTVPYLNWEQSPQAHIPIFQYTFSVTESPADAAGVRSAPKLTLDWPTASAAAPNPATPRTTTSGQTYKARSSISPAAGPILSRATLQANGLRPNTPVELFWMTARGSRTSGLGWALAESPLGQATTDRDGNLTTDFRVPDDLGGWHAVKLVQANEVVAEATYLVQPSLVGVTPERVRVGESFRVQIKGVGWTELDNIYTVVYDNSYVGFACGFNSNGDVTINLRAAGEPGVHLIDLYPAIYQGHGKPPWLYDTPQLTYAQDHPSLALGYRLPAFRLAVTVVD